LKSSGRKKQKRQSFNDPAFKISYLNLDLILNYEFT